MYDKKRPVNKTQSQSEKEKHVEFDSNVDIFPDSNLKSSLSDSNVVQESVGKESNISPDCNLIFFYKVDLY